MSVNRKLIAIGLALSWASVVAVQDQVRSKGASVLPAVLPSTINAKVVGVLDGDTLRVANAEIPVVPVRLDSIDAPEMTQPFGEKAKQRLNELPLGQQVLVKWKEKESVVERPVRHVRSLLEADGVSGKHPR